MHRASSHPSARPMRAAMAALTMGGVEVTQIKARMEALDGEIEAAMLRWEELESRAAG